MVKVTKPVSFMGNGKVNGRKEENNEFSRFRGISKFLQSDVNCHEGNRT